MMRSTRQETLMDILGSQEFETQNMASSSTMRASSSVAQRLQGVVGPGQEVLESADSHTNLVTKRAAKRVKRDHPQEVPHDVPSPSWPYIFGKKVYVDNKASKGNHCTQQRLLVQCDRCSIDHIRCTKSRSTASKFTKNLGAIEPWAFLGVWLERSAEIATREDPMAFIPDPSEVETFAKEHKWIE